MKESPVCVVRWLFDSQERFLLWRDGGSEPDRYLTLPRSNRPLSARTKQELLELARRSRWLVSEQDPYVVDLHAARVALDGLRPNRPLSQRSAKTLLEAWNALEDLARSTGEPFNCIESSLQDVKSAYEKLFHGNNLPAVTPEGGEYHPVLSDGERRTLKALFRTAGKKVLDRI